MALLTGVQQRQMLAHGEARARGETIDPYPVAKLYTPDAGACWILVSLASDGDLAYGLIDVGTGFPEMGEVSLAMLEGLRGPRGMAVVMEPGYQPRKTLSAYVADAQRDGMVTE